MTATMPRRALGQGALLPPGEAPAPFPDSEFVAPDQALDVACHALEYRSPKYSAHAVLARWQRVLLVICFLVLLAGLIVAPGITGVLLIGLLTCSYLWALVFRLLIFKRGARGGQLIKISDEEARSFPESELPTYTVLVPVFREPLIGELVEALERIDYPRDKLDIRLLLESGDTETIDAASRLRPRAHLTVVQVPKADPQTKPKACNFGLLTSRGELCTIYDAEDQPDPLQLRKAVIALHRLGPAYACVQARLGFYNSRQNLLTRWFTLDYGTWFSNILPGLVDICAPIPWGEPRTISGSPRSRSWVHGIRGTSPRTPTWDSGCGGPDIRSACSTPRPWRRPTPTPSTGSGSVAAGTRDTCRPSWCTCGHLG